MQLNLFAQSRTKRKATARRDETATYRAVCTITNQHVCFFDHVKRGDRIKIYSQFRFIKLIKVA